jgi:hypothetical protein
VSDAGGCEQRRSTKNFQIHVEFPSRDWVVP